MQTQTIIDPRLEIAETLFEARAEIRYVLARPLTQKLLQPVHLECLESLLDSMEGIEGALQALSAD